MTKYERARVLGTRALQIRCSELLCITSNKNFILKYCRCKDGKRTEARIGMEGIYYTHSCISLYTVYLQHIIIISHTSGMQEWLIQIPPFQFLFLFSFHPYMLYCFMCMHTKPHPHHRRRRALKVLAVFALVCTFPAFS